MRFKDLNTRHFTYYRYKKRKQDRQKWYQRPQHGLHDEHYDVSPTEMPDITNRTAPTSDCSSLLMMDGNLCDSPLQQNVCPPTMNAHLVGSSLHTSRPETSQENLEPESFYHLSKRSDYPTKEVVGIISTFASPHHGIAENVHQANNPAKKEKPVGHKRNTMPSFSKWAQFVDGEEEEEENEEEGTECLFQVTEVQPSSFPTVQTLPWAPTCTDNVVHSYRNLDSPPVKSVVTSTHSETLNKADLRASDQILPSSDETPVTKNVNQTAQFDLQLDLD